MRWIFRCAIGNVDVSLQVAAPKPGAVNGSSHTSRLYVGMVMDPNHEF